MKKIEKKMVKKWLVIIASILIYLPVTKIFQMSMSINEALNLWDKMKFGVGDFETFCRIESMVIKLGSTEPVKIDHGKTPCDPCDPCDPSNDQKKTQLNNSDVPTNYNNLVTLLCSTYDSKLLKEKQCSILEILINEHNMSTLWNTIIALNYPELNFICLNFFCKNISIIKSNSSIMEGMSLNVIKYITTTDHIEMEEIDIFQFVDAWIKINNPEKEDIEEIMQNIRFPLMSGKELIDIVRPTGVMNDVSYIKALEYAINPYNNISQKSMPRDGGSLSFYVAPYSSRYEYLDLGFRIVTTDDITEKFNTAIKKYVDKNLGIAALVNFSTESYTLVSQRRIRTDTLFLKCDDQLFLDDEEDSYTKNSICPIYNGSQIIKNIQAIRPSSMDEDGPNAIDGIAIYVRRCTRF